MIYIFLALIMYTLTIMFGTAASRHINTNIATAITNSISAIIPALIVIPIFTRKVIQNQKFGILMAVLSGVSVAFFVMAINKSYSLNKVGIVAPVVFGGAIFLSTILSYFVFKEKVSQLQLVGLIFLAIGFGLIIYSRVTSS